MCNTVSKRVSFFFICSTIVLVSSCSGVSKEIRETGVLPPQLNSKIYSHTMNVEADVCKQYTVDFTSAEAQQLQSVVTALQAHAVRPYVQSKVGIILNKGYANSCTGGQNIFIGKTLMSAMDEDMVVFVLAHELVHIDKLHPWRKYKGAQKKRWITLGVGSIASIGASLFTPTSPTSALAARLVPSGVRFAQDVSSDIIHKGYQRSYEYEADRLACEMMKKAGYDPYAGVRALTRLGELKKDARWVTAFNIVSTHPVPEKRAIRLREALAVFPE